MSLDSRWHRRRFGGGALLLAVLALLGLGGSAASAAGPPILGPVWASAVFAGSAKLQAQINPNGLSSTYRFDYITKAAYDANVSAAKDGFTGALKSPPGPEVAIGSGASPVSVMRQLGGLSADTSYRYRVVAKNTGGTSTGQAFTFVTQSLGGGPALPDSRAWEMVSPVDKNGGQVDLPGALAGGGVLQAAADGQSITYGSAASFGPGAPGAPPASQYIARRGSGGWATENITTPIVSGSYGSGDDGVPYQLFSGDLARGLLLNGRPCRSVGEDCPVANPPLPGSGAPAGYQNYYLRESATGGFPALLGSADVSALDLDPAHFALSFAGASTDLRQVVLSTCAALTADATEVALGEGCDPGQPNLYLWSPGVGLRLLNLLPAQSQGTPGAALAAQSGAISADGTRVYWNDLSSGNLYLREATTTRQVDLAAGGGGAFQTATADGSVAFYAKAGHLWRYDAGPQVSTDLTPSGGVTGVLGASADGGRIYYLTGSGLFLRQGATTTKVADAADSSNYPPTTGTARVSADGSRLVFVATAPLTGYDNIGPDGITLQSQVYLYDAAAATLTCVSCNPTLARPLGPSTIPGAVANGTGPGATASYKPRVLSASGLRVFFSSFDKIGPTDTNERADVYEWEAQGIGSCTRSGGCVTLIAGGSGAGSTLVDASADGSDVFILTADSLVPSDLPGSIDLYDARVGGGFPEPLERLPCDGDACQFLPSPPVDPTLTTLLPGPGNPGVRYPGAKKPCKKGYVRRKGKCVKKKARKTKAARAGSRR